MKGLPIWDDPDTLDPFLYDRMAEARGDTQSDDPPESSVPTTTEKQGSE